jgi:hypothetical protein
VSFYNVQLLTDLTDVSGCLTCRNAPEYYELQPFFFAVFFFLIILSLHPVFSGYGKAIPLQALTGPEGSRRLRLPDFKTIGT